MEKKKYKIMHKSDIIAIADESGITEILKKELCPACFTIGMPVEYWLENRCVDIHRSHSRQLFRALRLRANASAEQIINAGHGISITDNWWIQGYGDDLDYHTLKEYNESLADIALHGSSGSDIDANKGYKELGTVGSFEKCWRYTQNAWYMFKRGSEAELISEYFSYKFLYNMKAPVAEYELHKDTDTSTGLECMYLRSKDFTDNAFYDFEPFCNYFDDNEEPDYIIPRFDEKFLKDYVMMLFYDVLLFNGDRHNQNAGFLRDSSTGEIIKSAPYFDYNLALIATGTPIINSETGNVFTDKFLENEVCRKVLKENMPDRGEVASAASLAAEQTKAMFSNNLNHLLLKNYVIDTFDYIRKELL